MSFKPGKHFMRYPVCEFRRLATGYGKFVMFLSKDFATYSYDLRSGHSGGKKRQIIVPGASLDKSRTTRWNFLLVVWLLSSEAPGTIICCFFPPEWPDLRSYE